MYKWWIDEWTDGWMREALILACNCGIFLILHTGLKNTFSSLFFLSLSSSGKDSWINQWINSLMNIGELYSPISPISEHMRHWGNILDCNHNRCHFMNFSHASVKNQPKNYLNFAFIFSMLIKTNMWNIHSIYLWIYLQHKIKWIFLIARVKKEISE